MELRSLAARGPVSAAPGPEAHPMAYGHRSGNSWSPENDARSWSLPTACYGTMMLTLP